MTTMTPSPLTTLRAIAEAAASPLPWTFLDAESGIVCAECPVMFATTVGDDPTPLLYVNTDDLAFLLSAVNSHADLISRAERLERLEKLAVAYFAALDLAAEEMVCGDLNDPLIGAERALRAAVAVTKEQQ